MSQKLLELYLDPNFVSKLNIYPVLNPKLEWIDDGCYRILKKPDDTEEIVQPVMVMKSYNDNEDLRCEDDYDYDIEVTENGRFKTNIRIPQTFYSYIIGAKGSRRRQLETETKTEIVIPKQPKHNNIIIKGPTERSVALARRRLEMIDYDLRNRHRMTHFISFPLLSDEIKSNYLKFKDLVINSGHIDGVDESIFVNSNKLHLTIGPLVLLDADETDEASEILEQCKIDVIDPQLKSLEPLIVKVKGLGYMNDDPSQVDVLYATVSIINHANQNVLQKISDDIKNYFVKQGIMKNENDHVKLHATVMNTRYRKDNDVNQTESPRRTKRVSFDARPILDKYSEFEFGEQTFSSIHLSNRSSLDENGYYETVCAISCIS